MDVEETAGAASSAAVEVTPKITNFDGWDEDGTPVVTKKAETSKPEAADSASADDSKETPDDAADSAAKNGQKNKRKPDVEERFKKLTETHKTEVESLRRELEELRKGKETKADSSTAKPAVQKPDAPPPTRPKPALDAKGPDGKPLYASHDAYYEDLADWKVEQTLAKNQRAAEATAQLEKTAQSIKDAQAKYPDFKEKAAPLVNEISKGDCDPMAFSRLNRSPHLSDVLYTIGSNAESAADFMAAMRTDPGKAIEVIVLMEHEIAKELGKGKPAAKAGDAETTSARPKPRAPSPPPEVGGRGATGDDPALSAAKAGNFREFEAEQRRRMAAR
jgi:hypothetical protein